MYGFVRKWVPVLGRRLGSGVPGVVDGMRGRFVSAAETIVGVDRLDVEGEEFSFPMRDDEGCGSVGAEGIPKDVTEECK